MCFLETKTSKKYFSELEKLWKIYRKQFNEADIIDDPDLDFYAKSVIKTITVRYINVN